MVEKEITIQLESPLKKLLNWVEVLEVALVFSWWLTGWSPDILKPVSRPQIIKEQIVVTITGYQSRKQYTDTSPLFTSIGSPAIGGICAVSQDLLANGTVHYNDVIEIHGLGMFKVLDTMNPRHTNHVDVLVRNKNEEKVIGWRKHQNITVHHREQS